MNNKDTQLDNLREEGFNDYLGRLFPDLNKDAAIDFTFQVTDDCCLNCTYCYQKTKGMHRMSFDTAKQVIDDILTNSDKVKNYISSEKTTGIIINFIGGEPLLEIDLIDKITDYFIKKAVELHHPWATRYRLCICSNGILYFDSRVQNYIKKHFNNLSFSVSIDGNKELHDKCRVFDDGSGSYDLAVKAANHYTNVLGGKIGTKMTLCPQNVPYLTDAVTAMIERGGKHLNINCVYEKGWTVSDAQILYKQLKNVANYLLDNNLEDDVDLTILDRATGEKAYSTENWCGGNGKMLAVNYAGNYYPCLRFMEDSISEQDPYTIGDVLTGIAQDGKSKNRLQELESLTYDSQSEKKCIDCPISQGCGWCTAYNYQIFGTPNKRATFICDTHKAEVLASSYYYNLMYRKQNKDERRVLNIPDDWALEIIDKDELNLLKELASW